ncbi:MAG TPA: hypothetical protein VMV95_02425 [Bacillota bacterium]|nr:hypothetical protein [Bacillota bacterium]
MNLPEKKQDDVIKEIKHEPDPPEEPKDVTEWIYPLKWPKEKKLEKLTLESLLAEDEKNIKIKFNPNTDEKEEQRALDNLDTDIGDFIIN